MQRLYSTTLQHPYVSAVANFGSSTPWQNSRRKEFSSSIKWRAGAFTCLDQSKACVAAHSVRLPSGNCAKNRTPSCWWIQLVLPPRTSWDRLLFFWSIRFSLIWSPPWLLDNLFWCSDLQVFVELLEDHDEEVELATRRLIQVIESISGESLEPRLRQ